jgi:hypothetical protein
VKIGNFMMLCAVAVLVIISGVAHASEDTPYESITSAIKDKMEGGTTEVRKESYDYIKFDQCFMEYRVNGTYPSGMPYSVRFSDMNFSVLNLNNLRASDDYAAFVLLNFKDPAHYDNGKVLPVHTVVVLTSNYERAKELVDLFRLFGELCGAKK